MYYTFVVAWCTKLTGSLVYITQLFFLQYISLFLQKSSTGNGELKKARTDEPKAMPLSEVDSDQRDEVVQLYKLQMPEDLYHFWDFCKELCPDSPCGMLCALMLYFVTVILMGQKVHLTVNQFFCRLNRMDPYLANGKCGLMG